MKTTHPRAHLNTGEKPPGKPQDAPADEPARKPRKALPVPRSVPGGPGEPDRKSVVSTKLESDELAKLDRLSRKAGGLVGATRSATLRWLVQQADE